MVEQLGYEESNSIVLRFDNAKDDRKCLLPDYMKKKHIDPVQIKIATV